MQITRSAAPLGAEVTALNLAEPLAGSTFQQLEALFHDRGVAGTSENSTATIRCPVTAIPTIRNC